jgi:hypothetical protein
MRSRRQLGIVVAGKTLLPCIALSCGGAQSTAHVDGPKLSIAIVDPGAEPRRVLRYEVTSHAPERMEMNLKQRLKTASTNTVLETAHQSIDLPTVRSVVRIEVTSLIPGGAASVTCELQDVTVLDDVVDPAILKQAAADAASLKGFRASWRLAPSGMISDISVDASNAPALARDQLPSFAESIRDTAVVFPDAPIGIGATWQVTSEQSTSHIMWNRTVTYRLKTLTDSIATVDAQTVMRAPSQALSVEPNSTTRLTSAANSATSEVVIPLHGLVATSTSHGTGEMNVSMVRGHLRITASTQLETLSSIKPLEMPNAGDK